MKIEMKSLIIGCVGTAITILGFNNFNIVTEANAASKPKVCVWSRVSDGNTPEIGEGGKIEMDKSWTAMSKGGWQLKVVLGGHYVFEKCN